MNRRASAVVIATVTVAVSLSACSSSKKAASAVATPVAGLSGNVVVFAASSLQVTFTKLIADFDLEGWVSEWIRNPLPELNGKTPAEMLRNPEGQRAVEELLDRMRGGLPA